MILRKPAAKRVSLFRIISTATLVCLVTVLSCAQGLLGSVVEEFSRYPVPGASVTIFLADSILFEIATDSYGRYIWKSDKAGRYEISITETGYSPYRISDIILDGYTTRQVEHLLEKTSFDLEGVIVTASRQTSTPYIRTITPDDLLEVAGNFEDPVRIAHSQPGIVQLNDQANHLSARGQSPIFNSWFLEGLQIVNPNHTNNAGTFSDLPTQYGGGINMFSAQTLGSTDIYLGVNPLSVGTNVGATVDMHIHESAKPEWRAKAGLLGLELGGGTALGKKSILDFNIRYSFTGILTGLGADFGGEKINFYDGVVSFRNEGAQHKLKLFAWAGRSSNEFDHVELPEEREEYKDFFDIDYDNKILGIGGRYDLNLSQRVLFRSGFAYSTNRSTHSKTGPYITDPFTFETDNTINITSIFAECSILHSARFHSVGGVDFTIRTHDPFDPDSKETALRPYLNTAYKISPKWTVDIGGDMQYTFLHKEWIPGYRFQLSWLATPTNTFFAGMRHSANEPIYHPTSFRSYVYLISNTYEVGWTYKGKTNGFGINLYYQDMSRLFAYPLNFVPDVFEYLADFPNAYGSLLGQNSRGVSRHYGIEGQWTYSSENGWGMNLNQSVYKSVRGIEDTTLKPGRYNGQFATHVSISKEIFKASGGKNKIWNIALRGLYNGGLWEPEILTTGPPWGEYKYPVIYDQHLPAYKRIDAGITRTIAYSKVRWRYSLDIQNLFGLTNVAYHYYDHYLNEVVAQEQLGIIPVLSVQASW